MASNDTATRPNQMQTPLAFLVYNRPDPTKRVFARIREARPSTLFVVADGPKEDRADDARRCDEVRRLILDGVDWPCDIKCGFSDQNLGCGRRVSSGLNWVFEQVEEAIILEDDCLPSPDFFPYCEELLSRYRDVELIQHIGGCNPLVQSGLTDTYLYSKYNRIWGWATWRRAWQNFDPTISFWPEVRRKGSLKKVWPEKVYHHYSQVFDDCCAGKLDTWDYQWFLSRTLHGLAIVPAVNLVTNIGFGQGATHTAKKSDPFAELTTGQLQFPLKQPASIIPDARHDSEWEAYLGNQRGILKRAKRILLSLLRGRR